MPQGKHSSIRVALAVPPTLHEQLARWAEYEGRPVASLCLYLVEQGLRQAQVDGIAPSIGKPDALQGVRGVRFVSTPSLSSEVEIDTGTKKVELVAKRTPKPETPDSKIISALLQALAEKE